MTDYTTPTLMQQARLAQELAWLSYVDIPALFRQERITGRPMDAGFCPIATYLSKQVGHDVFVGSTSAGWGGEVTPDQDFDLPENAASFVALFDQGWFPDLAEEEVS